MNLWSDLNKVGKILSSKERRQLYMAAWMQAFSGLIDMVGVASVLPFLSVAAKPALMDSNVYLFQLKDWTQLDNDQFLILLGLLSFTVLLFNQFVRIACLWYLQYVNQRIWLVLHTRMFGYYLNQPYLYHLDNSGNALLEKLQMRVAAALDGVISPLIMFCSSVFTILFMLSMLIWIEPLITFSLLCLLASFYLLIYQNLKKRIDEYGEIIPEFFSKGFKLIAESFGAIKEIKLKRNGEYYLNEFHPLARKYCNSKVKSELFSMIPGSLVEIFAFGVILMLTMIMMSTRGSLQETIPTLGLFALALRRVLPAVQGVYWQIFQIRYHYPSYRIIYDDLRLAHLSDQNILPKKGTRDKLKFNQQLAIKDLSFAYPRTARNVLDSISLVIPTGSLIGIAGGSGAGKTTLIDLILGLFEPDSGSIFINGSPLNKQTIPLWQACLGYVPQAGFLADGTITRNIAFGIHECQLNHERVREVARIAHISEFIESELPQQYETLVGERGVRLSGGQRQRLCIARALYDDPQMLILDEATSALDGITEEKVMNSIQKLSGGKTILLIAHRLTTLQECDTIFLLNEGKLIDQGNFHYLMESNLTFRQMARKESEKHILESQKIS